MATDIRSHGQTVRDFLADTLANAKESERRIAAANTLSLINLPEAAKLLANYYANRTEVRPALVRLGDLAVPELKDLVQQRHLNALDDLQAIGTTQAAITLASFLWDEDIVIPVLVKYKKVQTYRFHRFAPTSDVLHTIGKRYNNLASRAALNLASLLPKSEIENALREYQLTEEKRNADWFEWVWEPFNEPVHSSLPFITGRIAHLINQVTERVEVSFHSTLDPRIIIPLAVQIYNKQQFYNKQQPEYFYSLAEYFYSLVRSHPGKMFDRKFVILLDDKKGEKRNLDTFLYITLSDELKKGEKRNLDEFRHWKVQKAVKNIDDDAFPLIYLMKEFLKLNASHLLNVLNFLKPEMQIKLFQRLAAPIPPVRYDDENWEWIFTPELDERSSKYPTVTDWEEVFSPIEYDFQKSWHNKLIRLMFASVLLVGLTKIVMSIFQSQLLTWQKGVLIYLTVGWAITITSKRASKRLRSGYHHGCSGSCLFWFFLLLFFPYYTTLAMLDFSFSWWRITGIWLTFTVVIILLTLVGKLKERRAQNLLHGILDPPNTSNTSALKQRSSGWLRWFKK